MLIRLETDPFERCRLGTELDILELVEPAITALVMREESLAYEEANSLGMRWTVLVNQTREERMKAAISRIEVMHTCSCDWGKFQTFQCDKCHWHIHVKRDRPPLQSSREVSERVRVRLGL